MDRYAQTLKPFEQASSPVREICCTRLQASQALLPRHRRQAGTGLSVIGIIRLLSSTALFVPRLSRALTVKEATGKSLIHYS